MKKKVVQIYFYKKILGSLIKKGKKSKVRKMINSSFFDLSRLIKKSGIVMITKIFLMLNTFVDIKNVQKRKRSFLVPMPVNSKRRFFLITKWVSLAIKRNTQKTSFLNKFTKEIFLILKNMKCDSLKSKLYYSYLAVVNRSNTHYRW
jgi:ribosomal protein S7